ncbi:MAG: glycosyltransferase family 4 protein [Aureliella sp.]
MISVLWVFDALSPQMLALAAEVDRQPDMDLQIISPHPLPNQLSHLSAPAVTCRNKIDLRAVRQIRSHLVDNSFDIAHAYTSRNMANLAWACLALRQAPRLIGYRGTIDRLSRLDPANWLTFYHPQFAVIDCVCHATQAALAASGLPKSKLEAVWEGCAPQTLIIRNRQLFAEYDIPRDAFVIGTVANARPVKGIDVLLRSAIELAEELDVYCMVVGDIIDPIVAKLAQDPRLKGRVKLIGSQPSGGGFCGLFDLYVAPSRKEGLSMGIMEAMSQGTCPIVTNVGGNPELVRNGIDGIVIPPDDPPALNEAIRNLWGNPEKRVQYAASAQRRVAESFSIEAWANRLCNLYRRVAGTDRTHPIDSLTALGNQH